MLNRKGTVGALVLSLLVVATLLAAPPAAADYVYCPPNGGPCIVIVTSPGGPGGGGGGGGGSGGGVCQYQGQSVNCFDADIGWYIGGACYSQAERPRPPYSDPRWEGHTNGDIYDKTCVTSFVNGVPQLPGTSWSGWLRTPPARPISPATLAARAINLLGLTGPDIGIVPKPGSQGGLVGLPVWLWTRVAPTTWGPNSATAAVPGLSVTARANASKIVWSMGDGHSVTCNNPGTPYDGVYGKQPSPRCGFAYSTPGVYTVTGTTYWHVTWAGGGQTGSLDVQRSSSTQIVIGELQVLVQ